MLVYWVTQVSPSGEIITTLYEYEEEAFGYIRQRFCVPDHVSDSDAIDWLDANCDYTVAMDYDEI